MSENDKKNSNKKKDELIKKLHQEKADMINENKILKNKIENLKKENEDIRKETTDKILTKIDSIVAIEKYIDVVNNKCIELKNKLYYDSFFNFNMLYIKFDYRNIPLTLNKKKTYGYHYCYNCYYQNYDIGFKNKNFMLAKLIPNFYFTVFFYYYKKKNKLIVSIDGQIKDEKHNWIYFVSTFNKNHNNPEFQEIFCANYNDFKWPIKHNIISKDAMLNIMDETVITISKESIKNE